MSGEPHGKAGPATDYLDLPVGRFLDALSAATPAPSGGGAAALAVAFAAGLCVMAAGLSTRHLPGPAHPAAEQGGTEAEPGAQDLAERARRLGDRVAPLAQADADGYRAVLAAIRAGDKAARQAALSEACAVPMQVAQIGAEVAGIAATLAARGNPGLRGDAVTAALLAAAGSRAAAALVRINLAGSTGGAGGTGAAGAAGDGRVGEAQRLAGEAGRLAAEAEQAPG
jgi:methenyltetrahydrofolate cyclohydrolase